MPDFAAVFACVQGLDEGEGVWFKDSMCFLCTMQETPNSVEFSCKDFVSSLLAENVTPSNFSSLLSPLAGASMNAGVCCEVEFFFSFTWYASD